MGSERFVAVGLLTQRDLDVLGSGFRRAFPLDKLDDFTSLLAQIDEADSRCSAPSPLDKTGSKREVSKALNSLELRPNSGV